MTTASRLGRLFLLLLTASALAQNPALTTVSDTVYQADGAPATGVLLISWPEFTTSGGQAVAAGETTTTLGSNGALSVQLVPNASAIPANTVYTVVYQLTDVVKTEYWVVPASSPATLAQVRTVLGAANSASQMASQQYVENAVAGKANDSAVVHLAGSETISGIKQFSISPSLPTPVNPGDGATKGYVDNSVQNSGSGNYVSIAGATMTGPLTLSGSPSAPGQAATKNYVDLGLASKADLVSGTVPLSELGPVATLNGSGNVAQNAVTATQLQQTPTQCNGAFATGVQANGNANCSVADVIEMSETSQPTGIPNYGIFWFDSTCHCPKVISNNGQPVQLGLLNVFNSDANTLEERNLGTPQAFRIYQTTDAPEANYSRLSLGFDSTNLRYSVSADYAGTGSAYGIEFKLGSTIPWYISSNFNLLTGTDNQRDIGSDALGNGNNGLGLHSLYFATAVDGETSGGSANDWANDTTTGTTLNKLAKLTSAGAAISTATSDTSGAIGVVIAGAGTTFNAEIVSNGFATCIFDGATTTGDYVQISGTTAGDCHDAGAIYPTSGQVLGRVMVTNAAGGAYKAYFFGAGVQGWTNSTNSVANVFGRVGAITAQSGDYVVGQVTGAAPLASPAFTGTPTAPTPAAADSSTKIATTAWVNEQGYGSSSGNVSGPSSSTSGDLPTFNGTTGKTIQDSGVAVSALAPLASPGFSGTPTAPTPATSDSSTKIATTAWVNAQGYGTSGGNVSGPSSANNGNLASFSGTNGKTIQDSGISSAASCHRVVDQSGWNGANSDIGLFIGQIFVTYGRGTCASLYGLTPGQYYAETDPWTYAYNNGGNSVWQYELQWPNGVQIITSVPWTTTDSSNAIIVSSAANNTGKNTGAALAMCPYPNATQASSSSGYIGCGPNGYPSFLPWNQTVSTEPLVYVSGLAAVTSVSASTLNVPTVTNGASHCTGWYHGQASTNTGTNNCGNLLTAPLPSGSGGPVNAFGGGYLVMDTTSFALTASANASGGSTVYTGTITNGASSKFAGDTFIIAGFDNSANNGTFLCTASTSTTLTCNNAGGVSDTHAATANPIPDMHFCPTNGNNASGCQSLYIASCAPNGGTGAACASNTTATSYTLGFNWTLTQAGITATGTYPYVLYLEWGAATPVEGQTGSRVLMEMDCVISYYTEGTVESGVDRGRSLAALDMELLSMCQPPSAPKQDYTQVPPMFLGTNIYWSEPVFGKIEGSQTVKTEGLPRETEGVRLARTVTVKVFFSPEANLP
ncbi:MAG TPA: hypothetical protein VF753_18970 [Terriglobales bacterium]